MRCWKYRRAGTELAVITYEFTNGTTTLVKNFWLFDFYLIDRMLFTHLTATEEFRNAFVSRGSRDTAKLYSRTDC